MAKKLVINQNLATPENIEAVMKVCPFGGLEVVNGKLEFTAGCKTCGLCVRKGPAGFIVEEKVEDAVKIDKSLWKDIAVFLEIDSEGVHPVSFELIGKAKELAAVINQRVIAVVIAGKKALEYANEALCYGADEAVVYSDPALELFNLEPYARCMEDFIEKRKPNTVLYGGTSLGRSFAPRVAAHFRCGLTADCTKLGMKESTDLIQVRPAFGGNVMAQIISPNHRPQMATVRYKIFKMPAKGEPLGIITKMDLAGIDLGSRIEIKDIKMKEKVVDISQADVIVACGRAFKTKEDLAIAEELAEALGGVVAVTRPMVEAGFRDAKFQIGLSGRTVAPKLIICLGISGAVQFTAGMNGSELIVSVNLDPNASIFDVSHYAIVGDVFKVVPMLLENIRQNKTLL